MATQTLPMIAPELDRPLVGHEFYTPEILERQEEIYERTAQAIYEQATARAEIYGQYDDVVFYVAPARTGTGLLSHLAALADPNIYSHIQPIKTPLRGDELVDAQRWDIDLNVVKTTNPEQAGPRKHLIKETIGATDPLEFFQVERVIEKLIEKQYPADKIKLLVGIRDAEATYRSQQNLWEDHDNDRITAGKVNEAYRLVYNAIQVANRNDIDVAVFNYDMLAGDPVGYLDRVLNNQLGLDVPVDGLERAVAGWDEGEGYYETTIMYQIPPHDFVKGTAEPGRFDPTRVKITPKDARDPNLGLEVAHQVYDYLAQAA